MFFWFRFCIVCGSPEHTVSGTVTVADDGNPLPNVQGTEVEEDFSQTVISSDLAWNIMLELEFNTDVSVDLFQLTTNEKCTDITTGGFGSGFGLITLIQHAANITGSDANPEISQNPEYVGCSN